MNNIACNLIYNNGDEDAFVGFKTRCDIKNIIYNVELGSGRWCSQPACSCRKYYDRGFKGFVERYPCNESHLFEDWEWNPGSDFKTDTPFKVRTIGVNKLAILTTKFPFQPETERKIVGFLKIKRVEADFHKLVADRTESVRLTLDEAHELNFWNYHKNNNSSVPDWRQGRFRYLSDTQVAAILHDLRDVIRDETTQSIISRILNNHFEEHAFARPNVVGCLSGEPVKKIMLKRKYGKGGESKEHKELKQYIANNPHRIGLNPFEVRPLLEHLYVSGDLVDILFAPTTGKLNTVVEIELDNVEPGIHQAIKYRALRCSQLGLPLTDNNVRAAVVAWKLSESEKRLCAKYGIIYHEVKL